MSTTFVVPYPPGIAGTRSDDLQGNPLLPGPAPTTKEIHGYNPDLGLSVFTEAAIALTATHGKAHAHAPPETQASITLTD